MKKTIYYFASYDTLNSKVRRRYTLAATTKIDYIISVLNQIGYDVKLISASYILEKRYVFDRGVTKKLNDKTSLILSPSFGSKTLIGKYLGIIFTSFCFFLKLLSLNKDDTLFVYHAPWYYFPIKLAKKIKGFRLILEVEEIYTLAFERDNRKLKTEMKMISLGDAYIYVSDLLKGYIKEYIYIDDKKSAVCYGPCKVIDTIHERIFTDERIHLVYAGSLSKYKGCAQNAVQVAGFLPENYVIHILGFGEKNVVSDLVESIENINKTSQCKVYYEGIKPEKEYEVFMNSCDIGLNLQRQGTMQAAFPSKVLVYLSMGLNVVSSELESVVNSKVKDIVAFYSQENPQAMAETIKNARCFTKEELKEKIQILNDEFIKNIDSLIENKE